MAHLETMVNDLEFDTVGGQFVDEFERTLSGKSPYLGTLPWALSFEVHEEVIDGLFITTLREENGEAILRREHASRFQTLEALMSRVEMLLDLNSPFLRDAVDMKERLAEHGYRMAAHLTGRKRGHVSTHTILADSISQLDAALLLESDPEVIFDLLDKDGDPLRAHVKFGTPYRAAQRLAIWRPEYREVVNYMRAHGAH